ncbi:AMP-dependent synthetase/ligase [Leptospira sp. GIMC2001]|uniref:AMP-dependent synthetase/ligase n=1 Tax=Leptospira sp. GIMC2001 TaxID=1513297 RepID=UPI00234A34FE|nr:AMP-binding protein [Leptospira sp. GIMC2001]WCL50233.1 AMP-binding protein [Leptospira sp. GIMC2001]
MNNNKSIRYFYDLLVDVSSKNPNKISFRKRSTDGKSFPGISFSELKRRVDGITAGFIADGVKTGDRIAYLCDATTVWIQVDLAIISAGAVSVPRGTDVVDDDIIYILSHSECRFAVVQTANEKLRLEKLKDKHFPKLEKIYVLELEKAGEIATGAGTIEELRLKGDNSLAQDPSLIQNRIKETNPDDLATLIYTSGTTGSPKGVMLSQTGWITAITSVIARLKFEPDDRGVSLLPPWHAFERAVEYAILALGIDFTVSNMGNLKDDLRDFKPTIFPSVPRIWESVYSGIMGRITKAGGAKERIFKFALAIGMFWAKQKSILLDYDTQILRINLIVSVLRKIISLILLILASPLKLFSNLVFSPIHKALGGHLRVSISAGSALPSVVDNFLSAIGIKVLEGYGMTETSAVVSIRYMEKPTKMTVGVPIDGYDIKIKDDQNREVTKQGMKGTLWIRSKQILKGYYKRPELNDKVFDKDGFFDTGDIMLITHRGELMFAGRAKDTIALAGGENVEPIPIEDKLHSSNFVDQVMVVGHDKKTLGVIIVPKFENVISSIPNIPKDPKLWNENKEIRNLFKTEITSLISKNNGFKNFEQIPGNCFYLSPRQFDPDTEMTRTLKMKRNVIQENFQKEIDGMYRN